MNESDPDKPAARRQATGRPQWMAFALTGLVAAMLGLSFAAVPLYRLFCQVTGYGGTTQRADRGADTVLERTMTVRFDGNVAQGVPWRFRPVQNQISVRIGETALAHYEAVNLASRAVSGTAVFNVTPEIVGSYFNKIECFCFTEQTLEAGQRADMPVTFFIDPAIADDPDARSVREVTLSYTFFPMQGKAAVAAGAASANGGPKKSGL